MRFRLLTAAGAPIDEGDAEVGMAGGALVVTPAFGQVLRVAPADIVEIVEPEPYGVRLLLADGAMLDLLRMGNLRTQLLAELREARVVDTERTLLLDGVGRPEVFTGFVEGVEAELRLYDDALVIVPVHGDAEKIPYPFVRNVTTDSSGYHIMITQTGREPVVVQRLARRTTEFLDQLRDRVGAASGRTAHFLASLLPGLGPIALRGVAGLLRDGLAAERADLDAVEGTVCAALVAAATLPERLAGVEHLESLGRTWIGFKQLVSVQRAASGGGAWQPPSVTPALDHDGHAGSFGAGLGGMLTAEVLANGFDGPFQSFGPMLALGVLGVTHPFDNNAGRYASRPRADVHRGTLVPARTDQAALTAGAGTGRPTVLSFLLCLTGSGHLIYEALNATDHATYVLRAGDPAAVARLNRALDLLGFRVEGIYQDVSSAGSAYRKAAERSPALRELREAFVGRVVHTEGWSERLRALA